ncbi:RNA 2',3'-cyclic phosphodiesterase [Marinactinospora thermotolerans]|uniref:RNA 2',3'-cyclic phosphodiesterase n=1 Tax=Marinactinospora thermotolerans DSM 45154 TaxID=1122192 RepID=A0A1T4MWI6_9ACTN|nr:RNA 2',3'-cyclic phosphodiesterase [Marinactinospora thermotolerans]SJZ71167.1 2'-5' RNA ligase [Marinactinospora thermotolerans DSM 45154]
MRLFVAIDPPGALLEEVGAAVAAARPGPRGIRWASREKWHVTLLFLGEVAEERIEPIGAGLAAEVARHPAPLLRLRGAGTFPGDPARARVLWAGVAGETAALARLATALGDTARDLGLEVEHRRYVPHLTLARAKAPTDLSGQRAALAGIDTRPWTATEVRLVHSRLDGAPRYQTLATWPLA